MNTYYQKKVKKRILILVFFFILWLGLIIIRLVQFQFIEHSQFKAEVMAQNQNIEPIYPKRGTIYDRSGTLLARSVPRQSVFCTPFRDEPYKLQLDKIEKLKPILELSERECQIIAHRIKKNDSFIWIKRKIEPDELEKMKSLSLNGIHLLPENKRFYPQGRLASQIIGRVSIDEVGQSGVEYKFNSVLEGEKGKSHILKDAKRREYQLEILKMSVPGKDIFLTIDETIQYIAERELEKAVQSTKAKWGLVIVSEPFSGEILAMANCPSFNLNSPPSSLSKLDRNKAIHHTFDPGSTFKIITASAALESNAVNLNDEFDCSEGAIRVAGKTITDHHRYGLLSFPEVIIHSSNVGTIQVGQRIGEKNLYQTIRRFGFGQRTGIDLPAEEQGIFRELAGWTKISLASLSIGYEISVTGIQMLQAINIIANKGVLIPPQIVKDISISSEESKENPKDYQRIISEKTALTLTSILQKVVQEGTGTTAQIKGYTVAGKTGTAQKLNTSLGTYSSTSHTALFIGFAPVDNPVFSMVVVIDEPEGLYYGGQVAAPVFREIGAQILRYKQIPPQGDSLHPLITAKNWRIVEE